jgi:hypothetical protein
MVIDLLATLKKASCGTCVYIDGTVLVQEEVVITAKLKCDRNFLAGRRHYLAFVG